MALPAAVITGLFGLGSSILSGLGKKSQLKRLEKDFYKRLAMLKPSRSFSGGRDPVVQAAIMNTFLNRGMANPYAMTTQMPVQPGSYSTSAKKVLKSLTEAR